MSPRTVPDGTPPPSDPPPQPKPPTGPGRHSPADDDYMSVVEVAQMWHCDKNTVYAAIYAEELPWIDMSRPGATRARIRIRRSAAHQFMQTRERPARAA